jgi:hypothetical protein
MTDLSRILACGPRGGANWTDVSFPDLATCMCFLKSLPKLVELSCSQVALGGLDENVDELITAKELDDAPQVRFFVAQDEVLKELYDYGVVRQMFAWDDDASTGVVPLPPDLGVHDDVLSMYRSRMSASEVAHPRR